MDMSNFGLGQLNLAMNMRYIYAAGMTGALWDHILTVVDEIEYFWRSESWTAQDILFLGSRYVTILGSLFVGIMVSGAIAMTERTCKALIAIETISIPLGICVSHALVALRVFGLWDHRRHAMKILWSIFATTYGCFFVLIALLLRFILVNVSLPSGLPFCAIPRKSGLDPGAWISLLVFNILIILLTASSAIERPYRHNKDVIDRLKRDGCISFLILTVTCTLNLVMQFAGDSQSSYMFFITVWAIDNSILSRMVLRIEAEKRRLTREGLTDCYLLTEVDHPRKSRHGSYREFP